MSSHRAWFRLTCSVDLPDDENDADAAFEALSDSVADVLNAANLPGVYPFSWGMDDADTEPEA